VKDQPNHWYNDVIYDDDDDDDSDDVNSVYFSQRRIQSTLVALHILLSLLHLS